MNASASAFRAGHVSSMVICNCVIDLSLMSLQRKTVTSVKFNLVFGHSFGPKGKADMSIVFRWMFSTLVGLCGRLKSNSGVLEKCKQKETKDRSREKKQMLPRIDCTLKVRLHHHSKRICFTGKSSNLARGNSGGSKVNLSKGFCIKFKRNLWICTTDQLG